MAPRKSTTVEAVPARPPSLLTRVADRFGVDPTKMMGTLKQTAFKLQPKWEDGRPVPQEVSNEQLMALLLVADQYGLNPWTKEIYAFPDKTGGITPIVGVDGWTRIINRQEVLDGISFDWAEDLVQLEDDHRPSPEWCECTIRRKDRSEPVVVREYLDECYRPAIERKGKGGGTYKVSGPWQSHTKRMLRHKTLIQAARLAFGFVGIYDEDEASRISEARVIEYRREGDWPRPRIQMPRRRSEPAPAAEPRPEPEPEPEPEPVAEGDALSGPTISPGQAAALRSALEERGLTEAEFCAAFEIGTVEELEVDLRGDAYRWMQDPVSEEDAERAPGEDG